MYLGGRSDHEIRAISMHHSTSLFKRYSKVVVLRSSVKHNILTGSKMEQYKQKDVNMQILIYPNNLYE